MFTVVHREMIAILSICESADSLRGSRACLAWPLMFYKAAGNFKNPYMVHTVWLNHMSTIHAVTVASLR